MIDLEIYNGQMHLVFYLKRKTFLNVHFVTEIVETNIETRNVFKVTIFCSSKCLKSGKDIRELINNRLVLT